MGTGMVMAAWAAVVSASLPSARDSGVGEGWRQGADAVVRVVAWVDGAVGPTVYVCHVRLSAEHGPRGVLRGVFGAAASAPLTARRVDGRIDVGGEAVTIETVPVGNAGNPDDIYGYGRVDYAYRIGKYEVSAGQYTAFLNAVARTDTYGLYNPAMWSATEGCRIQRTGQPGSYAYGVAADWAERPVNYVSWGDAARFANWLHNGQPAGAQDAGTTEDGSYFLDGATSDSQLLAIVREPDATWAVPSEDEWYKAGYHRNDGVTANYFLYPTASASFPSSALVEPDPGNHATYQRNGIYTIGAPYFRTEVGAHENSPGPYGTFDQGGNVLEWNEVVIDGFSRGVRGGSFFWGSALLQASQRPYEYYSPDEFSDVGFRVARSI